MDRFKALRGVAQFALLGGTFDPVHNGHLETARQILHRTGVNKVVFLPSGTPPHKSFFNVTDGEQRLRMVELAVEGEEGLAVSDLEVHRAGMTYTVDTVEELHRELGDGVQFHFVLGADALFYLSSWKNYERLLELCSMIAVTRPGYDTSRLKAAIGRLKEKYHSRIRFLEIPPVNISSSEIRQKVKRGESIQGLVPKAVEEYIAKTGLYQAGD